LAQRKETASADATEVTTVISLETRPRLFDQVFDVDAINIDDITPFSDAPADVQMNVLQTRGAVLELLSARAEMGPLADVHDADAEEAERQVDVNDQLTPVQRKRSVAQAKRSRVLAERCRQKTRQYELEILAHLARQQ
jgi:hypothetical protein